MFFVSYIWGDVYFISRGVGEEIGFFLCLLGIEFLYSRLGEEKYSWFGFYFKLRWGILFFDFVCVGWSFD